MGAYGTCHVDVRNLPQADRPLFAAMSAKLDTQAPECLLSTPFLPSVRGKPMTAGGSTPDSIKGTIGDASVSSLTASAMVRTPRRLMARSR